MFEDFLACKPIRSRIQQSSAFSKIKFVKRIIAGTFLFCSTFFILTSAQVAPTNIGLSGKVITVEKNQTNPLEYATVRLLAKSDSALVTGTTTDESGHFRLNAPSGKEYVLYISCMGYQSLYQKVQIQNNEINHKFNDILLLLTLTSF